MSFSEMYWVPSVEPRRLAFGPRPRAGDWLADEVAAWSKSGIKHVVSLLEFHEVFDLEISSERHFCSESNIQFLEFPIPDRGIPSSLVAADAFIRKIALLVELIEGVYIHCRAGIGRSSLVTAGVMLHLGVPYGQIFPILSGARRLQVPDTQVQIDWLESYSKHIAARSN